VKEYLADPRTDRQECDDANLPGPNVDLWDPTSERQQLLLLLRRHRRQWWDDRDDADETMIHKQTKQDQIDPFESSIQNLPTRYLSSVTTKSF